MNILARILVAAGTLLFVTLTPPASAETWPAKPVRLIIPYAPGGVFDSLLRPVAVRLGQSLGQPVVVENKPGASTAVGTAICAYGKPDGYTFCVTGTSVILNEFLQTNIKYDWTKDLAPVTNLASLDGAIVTNSSMPFNNLQEMIDYAKKNPGKLNFGSFGEGSTAHLYLEWIKNKAQINIIHVPYKGAAQVNQALLSNEVQLTFMAVGTILPFIKAGQVKALVLPAPARSKYLPDVPTMQESGYDFRPTSWVGVFAPAHTPTPILTRMQQELKKVVEDTEIRKNIIEPQFYNVVADTPTEFEGFLMKERAFISELVRISGVQPVN